jgi:hypothetical protein
VTEIVDSVVPDQEFPGNRKRGPVKVTPLQFGDHGELTARTIRQADLTAEEQERAYEMLRVQAAYLEILELLSYPVDPEGHTHDLSALGPTKIAIAWTMALSGMRLSGPKYIKKRGFSAPGCYADAHTWVDSREPDDAEEALRPEDSAYDDKLPPDTRRLAALRDGAPQPETPPTWKTVPKIIWDNAPREEL